MAGTFDSRWVIVKNLVSKKKTNPASKKSLISSKKCYKTRRHKYSPPVKRSSIRFESKKFSEENKNEEEDISPSKKMFQLVPFFKRDATKTSNVDKENDGPSTCKNDKISIGNIDVAKEDDSADPRFLLSDLPMTNGIDCENDFDVFGSSGKGWHVQYRRPEMDCRLNLDGACDSSDDEKENDSSNKSESETSLSSSAAFNESWERACPRVYARLSTFDESKNDVKKKEESVDDWYDSDSGSDDSFLMDSENEPEPLVPLSSCRSDIDDSNDSEPSVLGTLDGEWIFKHPLKKPKNHPPQQDQQVNGESEIQNQFSVSVSCQISHPMIDENASNENQINLFLSVDGACDFSDDENEEVDEKDSDNGDRIGSDNDSDIDIQNEGRLCEEVYVKQEECDDDEDEQELDPIDHVEVGEFFLK